MARKKGGDGDAATATATSAPPKEYNFYVGDQKYRSTKLKLSGKRFPDTHKYIDFIQKEFSQDELRSKYHTNRQSPVWKCLYKLEIPQLTKRSKLCEYICIVCLNEGLDFTDCLLSMFNDRPSNGATHIQYRHRGMQWKEKDFDIAPSDANEATPPKAPKSKAAQPKSSFIEPNQQKRKAADAAPASPASPESPASPGSPASPASPASSASPATKATPPSAKRKAIPTPPSKKAKKLDPSVITLCEDVQDCPPLDETNLLSALVHPMDPRVFMSTHYQKKALAVHASIDRFEQLISSGMEDLDLDRLLESTSSEELQAWVREPGTGKIESVRVETPKEAKILYGAGHSLYFRSSQELSSTLIPALANDIGMGFTATSVQGDDQGEIEIFCARAGHATDWHFDFMENFTVQLQGKKTWKLKASSIKYPVRGCTPHYKTQKVVEQQLKVHRLSDPKFEYGPQNIDDYVEVTLEPGSMLYFPGGMWHRVECTEDSISMNLSMFPTPHADIVTDALRHLLLKSDKWRRGVCYHSTAEARNNMTDLLKDLKDQIARLSPADILPERMLLLGRGSTEAGEEESEEEDEEEEDEDEEDEEHEDPKPRGRKVVTLDDPSLLEDSGIRLQSSSSMRINPLANLMHHADIPAVHQDMGFDEEDPVFILNIGFGHASYESSYRLVFKCSDLQAIVIKQIQEMASTIAFSLESLIGASKELENLAKDDVRQVEVLLHFLCHAGFLTIINPRREIV